MLCVSAAGEKIAPLAVLKGVRMARFRRYSGAETPASILSPQWTTRMKRDLANVDTVLLLCYIT